MPDTQSMNELKPLSFADDRKNTIATQLVDRLREAILSGEMQPGSKINLERARETFEVSLSPLREAFARLIADGLVELEDNRGYRVAPVSAKNLAEITELRADLETLALRKAMQMGDVKWESDVVRSLYWLNRTVRDPAQPETFGQWEAAHRDFHLTLIAACDMPQLLNFCRVLMNQNDRYRRIFLKSQPGDRNVKAEHSEIAEATVARDLDYACERLREHIRRTGTNLHQHLSPKLAG
jgi:DNA-binding GntR family transcriptional regulator